MFSSVVFVGMLFLLYIESVGLYNAPLMCIRVLPDTTMESEVSAALVQVWCEYNGVGVGTLQPWAGGIAPAKPSGTLAEP